MGVTVSAMRRLLVAPLAALVLAVPGAGRRRAPAAGAADAPNPCKVVTTAEIAKAFGGADVSTGKKGLTTPVSVQCKYTVGATADLPEGDVIIHVMFIGGEAGVRRLEEGHEPLRADDRACRTRSTTRS